MLDRTGKASMRPRQACLGIHLSYLRRSVTRAASMRPRQACLGIPPARRPAPTFGLWRFNEAEASLPRNTGHGFHLRTRREVASMRPRQACLGIQANAPKPRRWRCGFNEAEASLPRNTGGAVAAVPGGLDRASMRPRQACLGIQATRVWQAQERVRASMRPRQACLGIPPQMTPKASGPSSMLQ